MRDEILEMSGVIPAATNRQRPHAALIDTIFAGVFYAPEPSDATSAPMLNLDQVAPWVRVAVRKLAALAKHRAGWDSYGGLPLKQDARERTVRTIQWLARENLPVPSVVLGSGGTVQLEFRCRGREVEFDVGDGNDMEFVLCDRTGRCSSVRADRPTPDQVRSLARWLVSDQPEAP